MSWQVTSRKGHPGKAYIAPVNKSVTANKIALHVERSIRKHRQTERQ